MKTLTEHLKNSMGRKYHLSYDVIDSTNKQIKDPMIHIIKVLLDLKPVSIERFTQSTLVISFKNEPKNMFEILDEELKPFYYYSVSLIAKETNDNFIMLKNENDELNKSLQEIIKNF